MFEIKNKLNVNVFSPNSKIEGTTNLLMDKQTVDFGFIKFGSRVDLFLPLNAKLNISLGEKVIGNKTIIAYV